eukprot:m.188329 g.188329  ORF g.188329 m.188329 type:complete len:797 (-) comp18526_c0_seq2:98-2488(-)
MKPSRAAVWALSAAIVCAAAASSHAASFTIDNDEFIKDGVAGFQIKAGCIHYSRVPEDYWKDRLLRLRAMGLNAIQTYVPWNWHQPNGPTTVDFSSPGRNITKFISLAAELDMVVVLRAGPYMCGEWEFGGLPAWIFENGSTPIRTYSEPYITHAVSWWKNFLLPVVKPLLYSAGGPVVMVQVENEYGSYGDVSKNPTDMQYMQTLVATARGALGEDIILFTTDGGSTSYMTRGTIPGSSVYSVGDGCGNPSTCVAAQKQFNAPGKSPFMCSECYTGWLTHWGEGGANTSSSAPHVDTILGMKGSISLYMGHGGTNFGYWSGANGGGGKSFSPHETSYDYDSPVSEGGEHGYHGGVDKYAAMQQVMKKYAKTPVPAEPALLPREALGTVPMTSSVGFFDALPTLSPKPAATGTVSPPFLESLGPNCYYGFAVYQTQVPAAVSAGATLAFGAIRDRVQVFVDGVYQGVSYRTSGGPVTLSIAAKAGAVLRLLVENMGRINFSHGMDNEIKGLTGNVTLNGNTLTGWTTSCAPVTPSDIGNLPFKPMATGALPTGPAFYKGTVKATAAVDTFLYLDGWTKGLAWMNGFALGRYWQTEGPQQTLFVPSTAMQAGDNTLVVLELQNSTTADAQFLGEPMLQKPKPSSCDATVPAKAGMTVSVIMSSPKLAHQQQWTVGSDGKISLQGYDNLCLTVLDGCPHASSGCLVVDTCAAAGSDGDQVFEFDATTHQMKLKKTGQCVDIWSHDAFNGAPVEVYACDASGEDNQRWEYESTLGLLKSFQAGPTSGDFVLTVCQPKTH